VQLATLGHRVPAVDHEVHQDLLELHPVGADGGQPTVRLERDRDVLRDHPLQDRQEVSDHLVEIEVTRLEHLPAREGEQFLGQLGGPPRRTLDDLQLLAHAFRRGQALTQQLARALDRHQQVVEVVSDAPGELAERLELLRLEQALLELSPLGQVAHRTEHRRLAAVADHADAQVTKPA
jgi:hypothetical protein